MSNQHLLATKMKLQIQHGECSYLVCIKFIDIDTNLFDLGLNQCWQVF
jgi:hypothetical protein